MAVTAPQLERISFSPSIQTPAVASGSNVWMLQLPQISAAFNHSISTYTHPISGIK